MILLFIALLNILYIEVGMSILLTYYNTCFKSHVQLQHDT